jgi:hypothetical protein
MGFGHTNLTRNPRKVEKRALFASFFGDRGPVFRDQTYFFCTNSRLIPSGEPPVPNRKIHLLEGHHEGTSCGRPGGDHFSALFRRKMALFKGNPRSDRPLRRLGRVWDGSGQGILRIPRNQGDQGGGGTIIMRIPLPGKSCLTLRRGGPQTGNWPFPGDTRSRVRGQISLAKTSRRS